MDLKQILDLKDRLDKLALDKLAEDTSQTNYPGVSSTTTSRQLLDAVLMAKAIKQFPNVLLFMPVKDPVQALAANPYTTMAINKLSPKKEPVKEIYKYVKLTDKILRKAPRMAKNLNETFGIGGTANFNSNTAKPGQGKTP